MDNYWNITDSWIKATIDRYSKHEELNQIFMRGPFAGWSERELFEFAKKLDENQKNLPLWKDI